jgi:hypothetical protein
MTVVGLSVGVESRRAEAVLRQRFMLERVNGGSR